MQQALQQGGVTGAGAEHHALGADIAAIDTQADQFVTFINQAEKQSLLTLKLRAGLAEVVKYGALGDADFFAWLEDQAEALLARDPTASADELDQAREKAQRAPWLLLAVCRVRGGDPEVPAHERVLSAGAAIQNMLLLTAAMGLGSGLTSGKALVSDALRGLFALHADEDALCFINIGHVREARKPRPRPPVDAYFSRLGDGTPATA